MNDTDIFDSPGLIWQGMSSAEIEGELKKLKARRRIIDRFIDHLRNSTCVCVNEYERFCDLMSTEGVDPILWIDGAIENIDYAIEEAIENANS